MALIVKAVERLVKFNKNEAGRYLYVMQPELYTPIDVIVMVYVIVVNSIL